MYSDIDKKLSYRRDAVRWPVRRSRSFKVTVFGTNRKRECDIGEWPPTGAISAVAELLVIFCQWTLIYTTFYSGQRVGFVYLHCFFSLLIASLFVVTETLKLLCIVFTALHACGLATRKLAVRLSNACIVTKWKICAFCYITRNNVYPSFVDTKNGCIVGGDPFYLKFWVKLTPLERKRRFSVDIRLYRHSRNA